MNKITFKGTNFAYHFKKGFDLFLALGAPKIPA